MKNRINMVHLCIEMFIVLVFFSLAIAEDNIHVDGRFRWTNDDIATKDLLCPECCKKDDRDKCIPMYWDFATEKTTICCAWYARPYWTFSKYSYLRSRTSLQVEYNSSTGKNLVIDKGFVGHVVNMAFYYLDHHKGSLSSFPDNLCQFPRIVSLKVSMNSIENITDLGCLNILDTLDISYNRLKVIKSFTFANLAYLRNLYLSHNLITTLEPRAFKYHPRSLNYVDLSSNRLLTLDITNIILGYFFRIVNYSHNTISNLTNLSKWKGFQEGDQVGSGAFSLYNNNLTRIPDLIDFGFKNMYSVFKIVFNYRMDLQNNPWICDCFMYPYMNIWVRAKSHFGQIETITCKQPTPLQGYGIKQFRKNKKLLHKLICKVSMKQKCPPKCHCFNQPSMNRVVVNCSLSERQTMPKIVPELDNLDIDLSRNGIQVFQNCDYLNRTIKIDLSSNKIHTIDPKVFAIKKLDIIFLYNNSIISLDRSVQLKSPCKLQLGHVSLSQCTCAMHFITIWLEKQSVIKCGEHLNTITCKDRNKEVNLSEMSEKELCPLISRKDTTYIWFVGAIFFILALILLYFNFRYEIKLVLRHCNIYLDGHDTKQQYLYDVYISFNVENNGVRIWTIQTLVSHLESRGYKVCLPPRDFEYGGIHSEQIPEKINFAHSFVIVLSEDYFKSQFQAIEWIHIWDSFKTNINSNLVIINHDILRIRDLQDKRLKAFIRFGYSFDFSDFKNNLLTEIEKRLNKRKFRKKGRYKSFENFCLSCNH